MDWSVWACQPLNFGFNGPPSPPPRGHRLPSMKRPYLALAALALVAGLAPAPTLLPKVWAETLFSSAPVEPSSFAVLGRPVGTDDWTLVVLEQLRARPFCWTPRPDGLIDPTLNRFDFTGICGRFIDSNGYSLRIQDNDLSHAYRLRLEQKGSQLQLLASSPSQPAEILVGRGTVPRRDRDLFVVLQLEPGWSLRRRVFGRRSLNHVYFSNAEPLDTLIAAASGRPALPLVQAPPPLTTRRRSRSPMAPAEPPAAAAVEPTGPAPGPGVITLQVIPYEERNDRQSSALPGALPGGEPAVDPTAQAQGL